MNFPPGQPGLDNFSCVYSSCISDNGTVRPRDDGITPVKGGQGTYGVKTVYKPFHMRPVVMDDLSHAPAQLFPEELQSFLVKPQQMYGVKPVYISRPP